MQRGYNISRDMTNRRELLNEHDNDYGFDVQNVLAASLDTKKAPSFSVVIPYYETGENFRRCLYFVKQATHKYPGKSEIIVVDDGSVSRKLLSYIEDDKEVRTIIFRKNRGRTEARNAGLAAAKNEFILFLDSDVLVDEDVLINHAKIHIEARKRKLRAICIGFFEFTNKESVKITQSRLLPQDIEVNDFRIDCVYGASWIGCEDDKQFIGQHMNLIDETQNLRSWKGQYKAWMLPNMVLGGAFSVVKEEINAVEGFDTRFAGYGFTETSAVTRMVAERNNVVIPCLAGGAIHIEDESINVSRDKKDEIFKEKHDFYFNVFLTEEL